MLKKVICSVLSVFLFTAVFSGMPAGTFNSSAAINSYEAESASLTNGATKTSNSGASGGYQVNNMGGTTNGTVTFTNVYVSSAGNYTMTVYYATADQRSFYVTVNTGGYQELVCAPSGGWNTIGSVTKTVSLNAGNNTIKIDNGAGYAPNLDRITIDTGGNVINLTNGNVRVEYNLGTGTANFYYGGAKKISNFYAGVQGSSYYTSKQYSSRTYSTSGNTTTVTLTGSGLPTMKQIFILNGGNKFLTRVTVEGSNLSSNWMGPVVMDTAGGVDLGSSSDNRVLWIPFDNDAWVRYNSASINNSGTSFEAAAFYDNTNRNGLVVGSVTHDTWKTGVYYAGASNKLNNLNVYGGVTNSTWTHDYAPHGSVTGSVLYSPIVFVGYSSDWRNLLEEYASANAAYQYMMSWSGGVPFGWNSWGKIQSGINYSKAITVADYIKNNLMNNNFNNNSTAYINLDSYWDNLSDTELGNFVSHCHAQGQKAGIYWGPFCDWGKNSSTVIPGSTYTYGQTWMKSSSGTVLSLDGAYAMDPTHPGTKDRINYYIDKFKSKGFDYIKLDFLSHGALESTVRYDSNVKTGIQAYNQGMSYIKNRIGGTMFISLSIAPLFPNGYGHARRISCDTYGAPTGNASSEYMLNSLTYGWWTSGRLYQYNDPDHMVMEGWNANANKMRVISGAITGTVFLNGDDLTGTTGQNLAKTNLTKADINAVARLGKTFRPVEGNTGSSATDTFVLTNGSDNYIAVFNFSSSGVTKYVNLSRAGLSGSYNYTVKDLWSGETSYATGTLSVSLGGYEAKLFKLN